MQVAALLSVASIMITTTHLARLWVEPVIRPGRARLVAITPMHDDSRRHVFFVDPECAEAIEELFAPRGPVADA